MNIEVNEIEEDLNTTQRIDTDGRPETAPKERLTHDPIDVDSVDLPEVEIESAAHLDLGIDSDPVAHCPEELIPLTLDDAEIADTSEVVNVTKPVVKKPEIPNGVVTRVCCFLMCCHLNLDFETR